MDQTNQQSSGTDSEALMLPCDQRYRTSKYFLEDQLRCSEAASDFRSVRALFSKTSSINTSEIFQFQAQPVPVPIHVDS
jgi:hypothetical protein